ncbi:MAG: TonB-dependent receptor family protein [Bacteroidia bacterium]|nr:TonB-dependent receptor family protein [Bacteroidia bacterium]
MVIQFRNFLFTACIFTLTAFSVTAQDEKISGPRVSDPDDLALILVEGAIVDQETATPLEFATISIFSKSDSSLVTGGLTDLDGRFSIQVKPKSYYALAEFIGYKNQIIDVPFNRETVRKAGGKIMLGIIKMQSDAEMLDEIEVRAEKSETQFSLDKKVFNVGKDLANRGGSAADILDNVPSVQVDIEGTVSLRGSEAVRILIDGKPSGLAGSGSSNGLNSLPANMIDKVEVITNPSSRYEAEGSSGIINIVLKKDRRGGFNGAFDATVGLPETYGVGANINYRKGKLNWFANVGVRKSTGPGSGNTYQERYLPGLTTISDQSRSSDRDRFSNSGRFGADYYLKDNEYFTGSLLYRKSDNSNLSLVNYLDYENSLDNLVGSTVRQDDETEDRENLEYSLSYRKEYGSRDHRLDITMQVRDNTESESSIYLEEISNVFSEDVTLNQRSNNDEKQNTTLFQLDYRQPLGSKDHKVEFGLRSSLRTIKNNYLVEEDVDGLWETITGLSNDFNYDEDIHAAYTQYGNRYGKFSMQVGLRAEYAFISTQLLTTDEINDRENFRLFPSIFLNYEFSEGNAMQVSFSQRIRRPRFWDLNPFFTFSDSRNFFSGNPNLDPEYSDSYEVGYIKIWDKATLGTSLFYRKTTDKIQRLQTVNPDGTTLRMPENLATEDNLGLDVNFSYNGVKWLRLSGNANFFNNKVDGTALAPELSAESFTWFGRMTARATFWKGSDLQLRMNHRGARETTQGESDPITSLDIGFSKDILQKNGTLTLSIRDVFNSRRRSGTTVGEDFFIQSDFQWRARTATLTLNYRINQKKSRRPSRNQGGGQEFEGEQF